MYKHILEYLQDSSSMLTN